MSSAEPGTGNFPEINNPPFRSQKLIPEVPTGDESSLNKRQPVKAGIGVLTRNFPLIDPTPLIEPTRPKSGASSSSDVTGETEDDLESKIKSTRGGAVDAIRKIYFKDDFITPELRTGINLLEDSQNYIRQALNFIQQGKRKESDELLIQFKSFLPELYCCRTISKSFGAVINSIHNALTNVKGVPLSETQLEALYNLITALLREPAMPFLQAVKYVAVFEEADFEVQSAGFDELLKIVEMMNEKENEEEMVPVNG